MNSPQPPDSPRIRFWRIAMFVSAGLFVIPPLFGLGGTVFGMFRAFEVLETDPGGMENPEALAEDLSIALGTTAIGLVLSVLGLIAFVVCLIRFLTLRSQNQPTS